MTKLLTITRSQKGKNFFWCHKKIFSLFHGSQAKRTTENISLALTTPLLFPHTNFPPCFTPTNFYHSTTGCTDLSYFYLLYTSISLFLTHLLVCCFAIFRTAETMLNINTSTCIACCLFKEVVGMIRCCIRWQFLV